MNAQRRLVLAALALAPFTSRAADRYARERANMVIDIERNALMSAFETGRQDLSRDVLQAFAAVPRHEFVPEEMQRYAYGKIFNAKAFDLCSLLPRMGHSGPLSEQQIMDLVAYLLDPASPVPR